MQVGSSSSSRRRTSGTRNTNGLISGSVWESRMKSDEVKGGIKVFNGEENSSVGSGNRTGSVWESRMKSDEVKGGIKVFNGEENSSVGSGNRIQVFKRLRRNQSSGVGGVNEKRIEKNPSIQLRKSRSDHSQRVVHKEINNNVNSVDRIEKNPPPPPPPPPPIQITKKSTTTTITRSDSCNSKDFGVCKEKTILISSSNVDDQIKTQNPIDEEDDSGEEDEGEEEEMDEEDIENELKKNTTIDVKEIDIEEQKLKVVVNEEKELALIPISSNVTKQSTQVIIHPDLPKPPPKKSFSMKEVNITTTELKPKKVVIEEKKFKTSPLPISSKVIRKPPQSINRITDSNFRRKSTISEDFERFPETQNKLQNLVDLIMWRDVSKSAFIFGLGTFVLLSSSFTKDINFSLISAISYMGLIYLAAIFLHRSILCRGVVDMESNKRVVVGEQEAIWLLKLILPYLNEFLLKIRSLFSGDPTTTMKLAVLLFILARCGSSITIWKVVKLGFFGVFTVPKVCSSYSTQLTGYGKFWVGRFRDAWESCTHKKAVAGAVFTLIWNMSSVVARIWAVFMLIVAVRYYQQSCLIVINEEWEAEDIDGDNTTM